MVAHRFWNFSYLWKSTSQLLLLNMSILADEPYAVLFARQQNWGKKKKKMNKTGIEKRAEWWARVSLTHVLLCSAPFYLNQPHQWADLIPDYGPSPWFRQLSFYLPVFQINLPALPLTPRRLLRLSLTFQSSP